MFEILLRSGYTEEEAHYYLEYNKKTDYLVSLLGDDYDNTLLPEEV